MTLGLALIVFFGGLLVGAFFTLTIVYIVMLCADCHKRKKMEKIEREIEKELEKDLVYDFR